MLIKNNSSKIVGISETSILPGDTGKVPDGYEKNPIVLKYIENGTFSVIGSAKAAKKDSAGDTKKAAKKDPAEDEKKTDDAGGTSTDPATDSASDRQAGA